MDPQVRAPGARIHFLEGHPFSFARQRDLAQHTLFGQAPELCSGGIAPDQAGRWIALAVHEDAVVRERETRCAGRCEHVDPLGDQLRLAGRLQRFRVEPLREQGRVPSEDDVPRRGVEPTGVRRHQRTDLGLAQSRHGQMRRAVDLPRQQVVLSVGQERRPALARVAALLFDRALELERSGTRFQAIDTVLILALGDLDQDGPVGGPRPDVPARR